MFLFVDLFLKSGKSENRGYRGSDKKQMVKIPTPEFIVLYNGKEEFPDFKELKLSDAFKCKREDYLLELRVQVYNINKGRNAGIAERSPALNGYSELVAEVNKNSNTGMSREEAIKAAIKAFMSKNILLYFFEKHSYEVENMLLTGWNLKDAIEVEREEARAEALKEGIGIGREEGRTEERAELFALWESGMSLSEAKQKLGLCDTICG